MSSPRLYLAYTQVCWGFLDGSDGKEFACNAGDLGLIPGSGRSPGEGNGNTLQYFLPGESHGQRSLKGYIPWDHKESDMTEGPAHTHAYTKQFEVSGIEKRAKIKVIFSVLSCCLYSHKC